ncbi:MAG: hypothetical protein WBE40_07825 [Thermoplasmata archaeon]
MDAVIAAKFAEIEFSFSVVWAAGVACSAAPAATTAKPTDKTIVAASTSEAATLHQPFVCISADIHPYI